MALSDNDEVILKFFDSAKDEVYVRIKLRDTLLTVYTTAVAATFGFAKATGSLPGAESMDSKESLLIIPYLAFAFTLLVSYHHLCIATLGAYVKYELRRNLKAPTHVQVFDAWNKFESHRDGAQRLRTLGQSIILIAPSIVALLINNKVAISSQWNLVLSFWFGVCATTLSILVIYRSYSEQKRLKGSDERLHDRRESAAFQQHSES